MADSILSDDNKNNEVIVSRDDRRYGNPLSDKSWEEAEIEAIEFAEHHGFEKDLFRKAALLLKYGRASKADGFQDQELKILKGENESPLRFQKKMLYFTIFLNSIAAAIQGWDQTGTNGANLIWPNALHVQFRECSSKFLSGDHCTLVRWKVGLVNATPYIVITLLGSWLSDPLNFYLGRRKTIFIAAIFSLLAPIASASVSTWYALLACRGLLGIGMGLKEVTVPILTAEISPSKSRGKLVMSWQIWTTIGILLGAGANLISYKIVPNKPDRIWRYQLGSAFIPAVPILLGVLFCPESPRWLYKKGKMNDAYEALKRLRKYRIQAARDLYYIHIYSQHGNVEPTTMEQTVKHFKDLFQDAPIRRATIAAGIVMAAQQLCGINILAFYSSNIFAKEIPLPREPSTNLTDVIKYAINHAEGKYLDEGKRALKSTMKFAGVNCGVGLLALPAIDKIGRRPLLLWTIPAMSLFMLIAGQCFRIGKNFGSHAPRLEISAVRAFVLLFAAAYSPGMGPVPFTYSAEVFPLTHREIGMGWAVAVNNFWGSLLALSFPTIYATFNPAGTFGFFAGLNVLVFILIFLFVPETKEKLLESLERYLGGHKFTRRYIEYNFFSVGSYYYRRLFDLADEDEEKPRFDA